MTPAEKRQAQQRIVRAVHQAIGEQTDHRFPVESIDPEGDDNYLDIVLDDGTNWRIEVTGPWSD